MAPKGKASDQALIELFLDMVAAERGGAKNTLAAYAHDLAELSAALRARDRNIRDAGTEDLRAYFSGFPAAAWRLHPSDDGFPQRDNFFAFCAPRVTGRTTPPP